MSSQPFSFSTNVPTVPAAAAAASLNNHGMFFFLRFGNLSNSLSFFRQALEVIASTIYDPGAPEEGQEEEREWGRVTSTLAPTAEAAAAAATSMSVTRPGIDDANNENVVYLVEPRSSSIPHPDDAGASTVTVTADVIIAQGTNAYARPINLYPSEGAYDADPLVNASLVCSILLFNVALVFHAMGFDHEGRALEDPVHQYVVQAQVLYRKSLQLLRHGHDAGDVDDDDDDDDDDKMEVEAVVQAGATGRNGHHPVLDVLHMALHNNLAAAAYALGEFDQCRSSLDDLGAVCAQLNHDLRNDEPWDAETRAILVWHANVFLCNAHFLRDPPHNAAAA